MNVLVVGGSGFLGRSICKALILKGDSVTYLSRRSSEELDQLGAHGVQLDLSDESKSDELAKVLKNQELVFHVAAKTGIHGELSEFLRINTEGTKRLLEACKSAGIKRFIYTSSPSATFSANAAGAREIDCTYPEHFDAAYPHSKALAEQAVLAANGDDFATTALRPHLIYGPGDPNLLPRVIDRQQKGKLKRVGNGKNLVSLTFVENAAAAHLQAAQVLDIHSKNAGKAYFIADEEPVSLWPWINEFLNQLGIGPVRGAVPYHLAYAVGACAEALNKLLGRKSEPMMNRFLARELACEHWYRLDAAREDFGYHAVVSPEDAMKATVEYFRSTLEVAK